MPKRSGDYAAAASMYDTGAGLRCCAGGGEARLVIEFVYNPNAAHELLTSKANFFL
jgi:hypothetical protein